jgi:hypothetical protein
MTRARTRAAAPPAPRDLPFLAAHPPHAERARVEELRAAWEDARDEFGADEGLALELTTRLGGQRFSGGGD